MNTKWTKLFSILLLTLMLFLVVGCDDDDDAITNDNTDPNTMELFGTWAQSAVTVDGVEMDVAEFFEWSEGAVGTHITFNDDFTYVVNEFDASDETTYYENGTITVTGSHIIVTTTSEEGTAVTPHDVVDGTWSISGDILTVSATMEHEEEGVIVESDIVLTFTKGIVTTNDDTDSTTIELFDTWTQSAVTVDGVNMDVAEFFEWSEGAVGTHITFNDDFTYDVNEFDASDSTLYYESGTITVTGSHIIVTTTSEDGIAVTPYVVVDGTWSISGNTLTVSATIEMEVEGVMTEFDVVLTWAKVN
ncbi:MAG: hypothetical protein U9N54_07995 [candidate division Zixibacteria bacterium]|nr:hypothetical protein [candidate division Zixibacteria bacterium]